MKRARIDLGCPTRYTHHVEVRLPRSEFLRRAQRLPPELERAALIERMRTDRMLFCALVLPGAFRQPFSKLHHNLLHRERLPHTHRARPSFEADAAPRESAKSTITSYAEVLHAIAYGFEPFVAILSATKGQSDQLVKRVYQALTVPESAPMLHELYGPIEVDGGATDFVAHCPLGIASGTRVGAFSVGGQIRGQLHGDWRPSLVIVDDFETPQGAISPTVRRKVWDYWVSDVKKAGGSYTLFRVVGTVLHPDSMLTRCLKSPASMATKWRAIEKWPHLDRWAPVHALWSDLADPNRIDSARAYYLEHEEYLSEGAELLWPEGKGLFELMCEFWEDRGAFLKERQNEPRDPEQQIFDTDSFKRCQWDGERITTSSGRVITIGECHVGVHLDPVPPKDGVQKGDYAALAIVARDEYGYRYVLECTLTRAAPSAQAELMWLAFDRFGPAAYYTYEDNGFQALIGEDFERIKQQRRKSGKVWNLVVRPCTSTSNKNARIARLEPSCENGHLEWAVGLPAEVMSQTREFPTGSHDDGPDAIERADDNACRLPLTRSNRAPWD